jgi:hypothetical protein
VAAEIKIMFFGDKLPRPLELSAHFLYQTEVAQTSADLFATLCNPSYAMTNCRDLINSEENTRIGSRWFEYSSLLSNDMFCVFFRRLDTPLKGEAAVFRARR